MEFGPDLGWRKNEKIEALSCDKPADCPSFLLCGGAASSEKIRNTGCMDFDTDFASPLGVWIDQMGILPREGKIRKIYAGCLGNGTWPGRAVFY